MKYSIITFDDNTFFNARINNNDMVLIERYIGKNPLSMFAGPLALGDLAFILYMSLRESSEFTLDDIYDYIDDNDITLDKLVATIIQLFKDMGYIEDRQPDNSGDQESPEEPVNDKSRDSQEEENKTFKQIASNILDSYLLIGTPEEFWSSNLEEVTKRFDRHKKMLRSTSESDYMLAFMIAANVGNLLGGKGKKIPPVEDFFPGLYEEVDDETRENNRRKEKLIRGFSEFAKNFNARKRLTEEESIGEDL